jgi:hypothetical protein
VEPAEIATIKFFHRPSVTRHGPRMVFGCSCGADRHPCDVLAAAMEAERGDQPKDGDVEL